MVTVISASPARARRARVALPLEPDLLAVGEAGRNLDLDLLAGRQVHAARAALGRLGERDGDIRGDVLPAARSPRAEVVVVEPLRAAPAAAAEHVLEDLVDAAEAAAARRRHCGARLPAPR